MASKWYAAFPRVEALNGKLIIRDADIIRASNAPDYGTPLPTNPKYTFGDVFGFIEGPYKNRSEAINRAWALGRHSRRTPTLDY
jgi:hypothetical protein